MAINKALKSDVLEEISSLDDLFSKIEKARNQLEPNLRRGINVSEIFRDNFLSMKINNGFKEIRDEKNKIIGFNVDLSGINKRDYLFLSNINVSSKDWLFFLFSISIKNLEIKTDYGPRIPYNDGEWFSNIVYSNDPKLNGKFYIISDIKIVEGFIDVGNAEYFKTGGSFHIKGNLIANQYVLMQERRSIIKLDGDLIVNGISNITRGGGKRRISPESLISYGLLDGKKIIFKKGSTENVFIFRKKNDLFFLEPIKGNDYYIWDENERNWEERNKKELIKEENGNFKLSQEEESSYFQNIIDVLGVEINSDLNLDNIYLVLKLLVYLKKSMYYIRMLSPKEKEKYNMILQLISARKFLELTNSDYALISSLSKTREKIDIKPYISDLEILSKLNINLEQIGNSIATGNKSSFVLKLLIDRKLMKTEYAINELNNPKNYGIMSQDLENETCEAKILILNVLYKLKKEINTIMIHNKAVKN